MANVDFLVPSRRSFGGFGGAMRMDDEQDGPGLGRYRHHTCYQTTTCNSNTLNFAYSSYLSPFTERQGAVDVKSQRLVLGSAQQPSLTGRCTFEGPKDQSGNDHVEFVCAERERGFGGGEKDVAGAAQDEELISTGKGGSVGG